MTQSEADIKWKLALMGLLDALTALVDAATEKIRKESQNNAP